MIILKSICYEMRLEIQDYYQMKYYGEEKEAFSDGVSGKGKITI
jgi:hypothetical protein